MQTSFFPIRLENHPFIAYQTQSDECFNEALFASISVYHNQRDLRAWNIPFVWDENDSMR